jgi:uncharacterized protein YoxC
MQGILDSLKHPNLVDWLQIVLDLALIGFLVVFFRERGKTNSGGEELANSLAGIIKDTNAIAVEFDANLKERQQLIQRITSKLDQKLEEAQKICQRVEGLQREVQVPVSHQTPTPRHPETNEIIKLARKGHDAPSIAQRLQKPLGEVEMVLSLKRLSPNR